MKHLIRFNLRSTVPGTSELLKKFHLEKGGLVQQNIDQNIIDYCRPYCPRDTGVLEGSPEGASKIGSGKVIYKTPYAHYLYYGIVYGPNFPQFDETGHIVGWKSPKKKYPTERELKYSQEKNPLAGPFWVARMKADRMKDIEEVANKVARSK